jgi:phosphatidylglycerophosphate synthase
MKTANRIQKNIVATAERKALNWLCARLPGWVTPDMLTATGFAGSCLIAAGYILSNWNINWLWLSIVSYFINWFGDSLDGSLARYRGIERPKFGYFIDHSADSLANTIVAMGIGLGPFIRLDVTIFCLAGYLLMSIHTFLVARVIDEFRLSYLAMGPTELRLVLIAMTLAMFQSTPGADAWQGFSIYDLVVAFAGCLLIAIFVVQTLAVAARLDKKEL